MEDALFFILLFVILAWIVCSIIWIISSIKRRRFVKRWFFIGLLSFISMIVIANQLPSVETTGGVENISLNNKTDIEQTKEVTSPEVTEETVETTQTVVENINIQDELVGTWVSESNETLIFWRNAVMFKIEYNNPVPNYDGYAHPWEMINENTIKMGIEEIQFEMRDKETFIINDLTGSIVFTKIGNVPFFEKDLENEFIYTLNNQDHQIEFNGEISNQKTGNSMKVYYQYLGMLYYEGGWKNGRPDGPGKKYYISGVVMEEGRYLDGELDGKFKRYHINGAIEQEGIYKSGELEGKQSIYYWNGNIESEYNYKNGELHGDFITYYENGNKQLEAEYKNPLLDFGGSGVFGNGTEYYENGKIKYKGGVKDGYFHGKGTMYNEQGKVLYEGKWEEGVFIE